MDQFEHITDNVDHTDVAMRAMAEKIEVLKNQLFYARDDLRWEKHKNSSLKDQVEVYKTAIVELKEKYDTQQHEAVQLRQATPVMKPEELKFLMDPAQTEARKIDAIKAVRKITKLRLKEAKEFVDTHNERFKQKLRG